MQRLVYAPQVFAYVQTQTETYNLTNDIIGGTVTRRLNAPSTATIKLQNRRKYWIGRFQPMDRIIIFLKKTQPILVFSGYLDMVPYLSITPESVEISASCTLKLLEFTYWDPSLPYVKELIFRTLGNTVWSPGDLQLLAGPEAQPANAQPLAGTQLGAGATTTAREQGGGGVRGMQQEFKDIGFGNMLHFLVSKVGGWNPDHVHILPIPEGWMDNTVKIFEEIEEDGHEVRDAARKMIAQLISASGSGPASGGAIGAGQTIADYPGDNASKAHIAQWMGTKAREAGLPPELPVMAALTESGLRPGLGPEESDADSAGFFQMRLSIWNKPPYTGYQENPALQMQWFIDQAKGTSIRGPSRGQNMYEYYKDKGEAYYGEWCQTIEGSAFPDRYQGNLGEARELLGQAVPAIGSPSAPREREDASTASQLGVGLGMTAASDFNRLRPHGEYQGTRGPAEFLYESITAGRPGTYTINSTKRCNTCENGNPRSGSRSDHHTGNLDAYAIDIGFGSQSPTPAGDAAATAIVQIISTAVGTPVHNWGKTGGNWKATVNGLRFQVIYRCDGDPCGGNHYNHIHLGVKNVGGSTTGIDPDSATGTSGATTTAEVDGVQFFNPLGAVDYSIISTKAQHESRALGNWQSDAANDMQAPPGTPTYAAISGKIIKVSGDPNAHSGNIFGASVTIQGDQVSAFYTHQTNVQPGITEGAEIQVGTQIAEITRWDANEAASHLHFAMSDASGSGIDPAPYLEATKGQSTPSTISSGSSGASPADGTLNPAAAAFNVVFNFPSDDIEGFFLRGARAVENDQKLIEAITEVADSSLRVFASHPNGEFMAWFPDYFNASGRNPTLRISENELISCNIYLSDTNLATHVYVHGNASGAPQSEYTSWLDRIFGRGIITIDQAFLLDSFLSKPESTKIFYDKIFDDDPQKKKKLESNARIILEEQKAITAFLERYGPRPYVVEAPQLRHPLMEFFIAYQWFQRKWAEQFQSNAEFTFMPELFPGTIVKLPNHVNMFVEEVTHNFDHGSGFTTSATMIAPSTDRGYNFGMALAGPALKPNKEDDRPPRITAAQGFPKRKGGRAWLGTRLTGNKG